MSELPLFPKIDEKELVTLGIASLLCFCDGAPAAQRRDHHREESIPATFLISNNKIEKNVRATLVTKIGGNDLQRG